MFTVLGLAAFGGAVVFLFPGEVGQSLTSPGPLSGYHAEWDTDDGCWDCHEDYSFAVADSLCLECHEPLASRIDQGRGYHAKVEAACEECHAEHVGRDAPQIRWPEPEAPFAVVQLGEAADEERKREAWPHEEATGFALEGAHADLACAECHGAGLIRDAAVVEFDARVTGFASGFEEAAGTFLGLGQECGSCHHDPHVPSQGQACADCHTQTDWKELPDFDHAPPQTRYPLEGRHADLEVAGCKDCHLVGDGAPEAPVERPIPSFEPVMAESRPPPAFRGVGFGTTEFAVEGETLPDCKACHEVPHRRSEAFLSCESCHTPAEWGLDEAQPFVHDEATTGFPLTGAHATTGCAECHGEQEGSGEDLRVLHLEARETCLECHEREYDEAHRGAFDGEMALAGEEACTQCHDTEAWEPSTYSVDVHSRESLPLIDGHDIACEDCHGGGPLEADCALERDGKDACTLPGTPPFSRLPATGRAPVGPLEFNIGQENCGSCHVDVHEGRLTRGGRTCVECHNFETWADEADLDMEGHAAIGFPINGYHREIFEECGKCHGGRTPSGSLRTISISEHRTQGCYACHNVANGDDVHGDQLSNDCASCHNEDVWDPSDFGFARHDDTRFPLRGAHAAVPCSVCHVRDASDVQVFAWEGDLGCVTCHDNPEDDPHGPQFADQDCDACHRQTAWLPSAFGKQEHARTGFALESSHDVACDRCHVQHPRRDYVVYDGIPRACARCHVDVHAGQFADRPGDGCSGCHRVADWLPSTFDHDNSRFALRGRHAVIECTSCHYEVSREVDGEPRQVVHYFPIAERACHECHQNPHGAEERD